MSIESVTLEQALQLMSLPRVVGVDEDGQEITSQNGRYGPYLKKGTDSRSLETEDQIFDITLDEAKAIFAQPKQRGRAAAKPPLRELGDDPASGKPMIIKDGRFGAVRDRRRVQRHPATRRRDRVDHPRAGGGAAGREAGQGSGAEEAGGEEDDLDRQEGPGEEGRRRKKTTARKAPAKKAAGEEGAVGRLTVDQLTIGSARRCPAGVNGGRMTR